MGQNIKYGLYGLVAIYLVYSLCFSSDSEGTVTEEVTFPTQGLITVLKEVQTDQFKIDDEITIPDTSASLVVANYMSGTSDTFTLDQIRVMETGSTNSTGSSIARAASFGLMGYFLGRSMASRPPAGAYVDQKTYDRVNKNAGQKMQQTAGKRTVTRPSGKSGYGGGSSSRSSGG